MLASLFTRYSRPPWSRGSQVTALSPASLVYPLSLCPSCPQLELALALALALGVCARGLILYYYPIL